MARRDFLEGKLVAIVGGSGFLGDHVAQSLLRRGARVRIASRRPGRAWRLKPLAQLGQLQFVRCDATRPDSAAAAVAGAAAVVNLVGTFRGDLARTIAGSADNVARAAAANGCAALVHVSAIGADADSPAGYARAKAASEDAVRRGFPRATIIRPGVLFGEDDAFVNLFARLIGMLPAIPVFGPEAQIQPLAVDDAAEAIAGALEDPAAHGGKTYEIAGPEALSMMELHRRIAAAQGRKRLFVPVPDPVSAAFAMLPGSPMNSDQWTLLQAGNRPSGRHPGLGELGVTPRPLNLFLDRWMMRYRRQGRFGQMGTR